MGDSKILGDGQAVRNDNKSKHDLLADQPVLNDCFKCCLKQPPVLPQSSSKVLLSFKTDTAGVALLRWVLQENNTRKSSRTLDLRQLLRWVFPKHLFELFPSFL
jgi:hypothetical protein